MASANPSGFTMASKVSLHFAPHAIVGALHYLQLLTRCDVQGRVHLVLVGVRVPTEPTGKRISPRGNGKFPGAPRGGQGAPGEPWGPREAPAPHPPPPPCPTMPCHASPCPTTPRHAPPCPGRGSAGLGEAWPGSARLSWARLGSDRARAGTIKCRSPGRNINLPESAGENAYLGTVASSLRLW